MGKIKIYIPVFIGLMAGQLFAESVRPFHVANTVRVGYNDNLYHSASGQETSSLFVTDIIDLSFHAALSDRTDVMVKSRINLLTDTGDNELYPNLYAMLSHSVSPRLLLRLSEYYRSGDRTGSGPVQTTNRRLNYYENRAGASADYFLNQKDRLKGSLNYTVLRNEDDKTTFTNDYTTIDAGLAWQHDITPQRTYSLLKLQERHTEYDNRNSSFEATDISAGIGHTFNQEWQGQIEMGVTYVRPDEPAPIVTENTLNPLVIAGLTYSPSPRTRLSGNFVYRYDESGDSRYGGQTSRILMFDAQHDLTAKIMVKAIARFINTEYDENASAVNSYTEDRMDLQLRLTYRLNRINFIELGMKHSENDRSVGADWEQNIVDIGWRVELK